MQILKATQGIGLRVTEEAEDIGLDISEHGESMVVAHNQVCPAHTRSRGTARARNACTARWQRIRAMHASRAQSLARHCADACTQRGRQLCCSVTPIHVAAYYTSCGSLLAPPWCTPGWFSTHTAYNTAEPALTRRCCTSGTTPRTSRPTREQTRT